MGPPKATPKKADVKSERKRTRRQKSQRSRRKTRRKRRRKNLVSPKRRSRAHNTIHGHGCPAAERPAPAQICPFKEVSCWTRRRSIIFKLLLPPKHSSFLSSCLLRLYMIRNSCHKK